MKEIYPFKMVPLIRIHCGCGCEDYLQIDRSQYEDDPVDYMFKFVNPHFYTFKERLKFIFTRKKNYHPFGVLIRSDQYTAIIEAITDEVGGGAHPSIKPKHSGKHDCWETRIRYDEEDYTYSEIIVSSIWDKIETADDKNEIEVYPADDNIYKPGITTILSPTFQTECELMFNEKQLIEFAQAIKFFQE